MLFGSLNFRWWLKTRSRKGSCYSENAKANRYKINAVVYWICKLLSKIPPKYFISLWTTAKIIMLKCILDVAIRTRNSIQKNKTTGYSSTCPSILWCYQRGNNPVWYKQLKVGSSNDARWTSNSLCLKGTNNNSKKLCTDWERMLRIVLACTKFDQYIYMTKQWS